MITTQVTFSDFWQWLQSSSGYKNNFSYEGARAVFDYVDEIDDGEADNYDPLAWCCEFTEYADLDEVKQSYTDIETMEDLESNTMVLSQSPLVIQDY